MKVTVLQRDICWGNPTENLRRTDEVINSLPDADLYVLPEMFDTGFMAVDNELHNGSAERQLSIVNYQLSIDWMRKVAVERNCAIAGSMAVEANGKFYNRLYFVHPDGRTEHYDKRHLFTYGGEDKHYTAGEERVIVEFRGVRILLQVCYDLRFPVWSRNRKDYDMIMYVASWPTSRMTVWNTLLAARAIENQCYVVGVNRVGSDPQCEYCGGSQIVDAYGRVIARCEDNKEDVATAEIDLEALERFRRKFPVLEDGDEFKVRRKSEE